MGYIVICILKHDLISSVKPKKVMENYIDPIDRLENFRAQKPEALNVKTLLEDFLSF
jgi:hypothetical protein